MAKIHTLKISNYRGIQNFEQIFGMTDFVCLIGRGDSGKTTILEAISVALSPNWNLSFYDTDFYNGVISNSIEIEVSLYDLPTALLHESKFGLYKRFLNNDGFIIDDIQDDDLDDKIDILTVKLVVDKELEPKWYIVNDRAVQSDIEIRANDRASLNVFLVSDFVDRHFSWNKGNPLYSLLREDDASTGKTNIIIDAFREVKEKIDPTSFSHLDGVVTKIKSAASELGVNIDSTTTTIDFRDISIKDGRICLHVDKVPFRLKGKGAKRLISIAIQTELAKSGGIILIDEIEQGLESDRARHLVKALNRNNLGQVFITTHSSDVLVELEAQNIFLKNIDLQYLTKFDTSFQGCLRKNPEAFFTKKIIVCEGATEIGICRAINNHRIDESKSSFAISGVGIVDGSGSNFIQYCEKFKDAGFEVSSFCDSDDNSINFKKVNLNDNGINVIDCKNDYSIEQQIFEDLPWDAVKEIIEYAFNEKGSKSVKDSLESKSSNTLPKDWDKIESSGIREVLGVVSKENGWFKRIDHGEFLGKICCGNEMDISVKILGKIFKEINDWVDDA